jgi:hypothetical protein
MASQDIFGGIEVRKVAASRRTPDVTARSAYFAISTE